MAEGGGRAAAVTREERSPGAAEADAGAARDALPDQAQPYCREALVLLPHARFGARRGGPRPGHVSAGLARRGRRPLPSGLGVPGGDPERPVVEAPDVPWLEPLPDALLGDGLPSDPAAVAVSRSSTRLALVAALRRGSVPFCCCGTC